MIGSRTDWRVPRAIQSPYYKWFVELEYPNLEILEEGNSYWKPSAQTGRWHIIEFYRSPVVPSLTPWNYVLRNIENVEISRGFVEKYVKKLDLRRREIWDEERAKTQAVYDEQAALDRHREDTAERAYQAIRQNDDLMQRIAKNGASAMGLNDILKHVPRHRTV